MNWYDLRDPNDPQLDDLAARFHLHPLHIEDCHHGGQRAKLEEGDGYLFVVMKPIHINPDGEVSLPDLDVFVGPDFLITVLEDDCPTVRAHFDQMHDQKVDRTDQLFYRITDAVVDSYTPPLDWFNDRIDEIEDKVLEHPSPETLHRIFDAKRGLIEIRRVLTNMRDAAIHLERIDTPLLNKDLSPFFRDIYDHLARNLDMVEMQRDLLSGAMDVYLSAVANRTNQVMKVLTVLGTIALPAIVISGIYGMNTKGLPWLDHPHASWIILGLMAASTAALLYMLKKFHWL